MSDSNVSAHPQPSSETHTPAIPYFPPLASVDPSKLPHLVVPRRPRPTLAFGFVITPDNFDMWNRVCFGIMYGQDELESLAPKEADNELYMMQITTKALVCALVYLHLPKLPRLQQRILPLDGDETTRPTHYLFVLKDNATPAGMAACPTDEEIKRVATLLQIEDEEPDWYNIPKKY